MKINLLVELSTDIDLSDIAAENLQLHQGNHYVGDIEIIGEAVQEEDHEDMNEVLH